jgi:hypothetical protein
MSVKSHNTSQQLAYAGMLFTSWCSIRIPLSHRLSSRCSLFSSVSQGKCRNNTLHETKLASLHIAFHSFFANNSPFVRYVISATECVLSKESVRCTLVQALRLCTGRTVHRGSRGIPLFFHDQRLEGGEESASRPGRFLPPGKTRYSLYRRLGGPQGRSGQVRKISPQPGCGNCH